MNSEKFFLRNSERKFTINEIGGSKVNIHINSTDGGRRTISN